MITEKVHIAATQIQKHSAATQIQKMWRGYRARKQQPNKKPDFHYPVKSPVLILGNEPAPVFDKPKKKGHFVYVGTGGLANFRWIAQILETLPNPQDGYTGIPKIFIVDVAAEVKTFWADLKKVCANAKTYHEFVLDVEQLFDYKEVVRRSIVGAK